MASSREETRRDDGGVGSEKGREKGRPADLARRCIGSIGSIGLALAVFAALAVPRPPSSCPWWGSTCAFLLLSVAAGLLGDEEGVGDVEIEGGSIDVVCDMPYLHYLYYLHYSSMNGRAV